MQRVDFFRLERPIQERFVAAAKGSAPPVPLSVKWQLMPKATVAWLILAAVALLGLLVLGAMGFGKLNHPQALQPLRSLPVYAGLGAIAVGAGVAALYRQRARDKLPFSVGIYLFPSSVIDVRRSQFLVRPLSELADFKASERAVDLVFQDGARFRFPTPNRDRADEIGRIVHEMRERLGTEAEPSSARELSMFDPLCDNGFRNPFSPRESLKPEKVRFLLPACFAGVLIGALGGGFAWKVRNSLAETALYRAARTTNTRAAYQAYVDRGGQNRDVREILLPRAQLAEIVRRHSLDELVSFESKHRGSRIEPEAQSALHQALKEALEEAKRAGTLQALKDFRSRFADQPSISAELNRALSEQLTAALRQFERLARPKPEVLELFRQVLNYAATHEGKVQLRFRRRSADSVAKAEVLLTKSNYFGGKASVPAQYFDDQHSAEREQPIAKEILAALSRGFSPDLLRFEAAPALPDSAEEDPKLEVPTLLITHRTEMSGAFLMRRPRAALTGVGILFRITFSLPNSPPGYAFKYSAWNAPDMRKMMEGQPFDQIYNEIGERGFSKVAKKFLADFVPGLAPAAGKP